MSDDDYSDDEETKQERFRKSLGCLQKKSTFERTCLIKDVLEIASPSSTECELIDFVKTRTPKVFAIAIWAKIKKPKRVMTFFKSKNLDDNDLPFTDPKGPLLKRTWYPDIIEHQWKFYAATFSTDKYNHDLEESCILPFTSKAGDDGRGSFGVVSKYVIHQNHMKPALQDDTPFAVKEIQATEDAQEVAEHWEKEVKALRTMNKLNQEHIVRFITAFRRRREHGGDEHYLMFEWADGGNLRNLWKRMPSPTLTAPLVKDVIRQVMGLAKALDAAHNLNATGASYRHGDLKPENILVFNKGGLIGTLKIGDWGEAREHGQATEMRPSKTTAKYGTRRYEAPEVETGVTAKWLGQSTKRRSRLYDIWAMGCITLELTIWLLYGADGLSRFDHSSTNVTRVTPQDVDFEGSAIESPVQPAVDIPSFSFTPAEPEPDKIPVQPEPESRGPARCLATDFRTRIETINGEDEDESYWFAQHLDQHRLEGLPGSFSHSASSPTPSSYKSEETYQAQDPELSTQNENDYGTPELDENDWKYQSGNEFASAMFESMQRSHTLESFDRTVSYRLCVRCAQFRDEVYSPGFAISYETQWLRSSASEKKCDLCNLFWQVVIQNGRAGSETIKFERTGPFLRLESTGPRILSIVRDPEQMLPPTSEFQTGFVRLPEAGQATHMEIIKYWLNDCDRKHTCKPRGVAVDGVKVRLPTRLIDVGQPGDDSVRLWATTPKDSGEWIALSHRWGTQHFSTTTSTLQSHLKGISLDALPATFRDAVTVTRALGRRYLWIDSLCVIQGPDGDFKTEAKRMEDVYSGAYCVIAASCAANHFAGFLKQRESRNYVGLSPEGKGQTPFYVCQTIDNFKDHVLDGELNRRGWVYQEHALARRTLFFTEHQTYFECRDGVRCETSTKLSNKLAAFLGDPDFPHILYNASQGEKILRYQGLYREYSRLGLSEPYDRPTAIDGLQQRLLRTMRVSGGFGVFDEGVTRGLLRRSLLWRRGIDTPSLSRIHFPPQSVVSAVPSWSWMAYTGGIDYLQPDFGCYEWEDLQSPWSPKTPTNVSSTDYSMANIALEATAREYDLGAAVQGEGELIFDTPNGSAKPDTVCVVLGKAKGSPSPELQRHYILIIAAQRGRAGSKIYERVGTGYLPGKCISPSGFKVKIH
ncbi:hypothetical protein ACET3X_003066 [Alternaria dauci]|uniref:Protein kinase domain-containing protein n=1 Tax=Alternaria dauci TaxID=48095 RepID=A0ABR3URS3_9PLEO